MKDPFVYFTDRNHGGIIGVQPENITAFCASKSPYQGNLCDFRPNGGTWLQGDTQYDVLESPEQVKAILAAWRQEQDDTPPTPEPEKPAYPKRSEVEVYDGAMTSPYWYTHDGKKVYDNYGRFVCREEDLQDG